MLLRKMRWLTAALLAAAALVASPARSQAGIQILIQETDTTGTINYGAAQYFGGPSVLGAATSSFASISITVNTSSGVASAINSLTTTVNTKPSAAFDPTRVLRVWVTDDGFLNTFAGSTALVENNAAASAAVAGGTNTLTNISELLGGALTQPPTGPLTGSSLGSPTAIAADTRPGGGISPTTTSNIASLPGAFAIQQTITVRATPTSSNGIDPQSTLGGSASTLVLTDAPVVPAPAGIVLALIGLPILGARRILRRAKD